MTSHLNLHLQSEHLWKSRTVKAFSPPLYPQWLMRTIVSDPYSVLLLPSFLLWRAQVIPNQRLLDQDSRPLLTTIHLLEVVRRQVPVTRSGFRDGIHDTNRASRNIVQHRSSPQVLSMAVIVSNLASHDIKWR